jgi:AraC-like DNA-binding protein
MQYLNPIEIDPIVRIANYHGQSSMYYKRKIADIQLLLVIDTQLTYQIKGKELHTINHGELLFIEPGSEHVLTSGKEKGAISSIHCEFIPDKTWVSADYRLNLNIPVVTKLLDFNKMHTLYQHCANTYNGYSIYKPARVNAIAKDIILYLCEHWGNEATVEINTRLQDMVFYIQSNLTLPITRNDIAEKFHITPEHVNLLFKKHLGVPPSEVINRERCKRAYQYLQEGKSVKETAFACGYNDPFYFSRIFKKIFNISPKNIIN